MTSSKPVSRGGNVGLEGQLIVEEKVTKASGEAMIRKYMRGRFLGKA